MPEPAIQIDLDAVEAVGVEVAEVSAEFSSTSWGVGRSAVGAGVEHPDLFARLANYESEMAALAAVLEDMAVSAGEWSAWVLDSVARLRATDAHIADAIGRAANS